MTTLTLHDFSPDTTPHALDKAQAGAAAYARALRMGYCRTAADALRRTAKREYLPGETPEACARRIVAAPASSATLPPRGAA